MASPTRYRCINGEYDSKGLKIYDGVNEFLDYCRKTKKVEPELWVMERGVMAREPGDFSPFAWKMTLIMTPDLPTREE